MGRFKDFERDLPKVKAAGFQGLCFDIEMTKGEMEASARARALVLVRARDARRLRARARARAREEIT